MWVVMGMPVFLETVAAPLLRKVGDALLADLPEALENAQTSRVGEGQEMIGKLVARALKKHKACFIRV